MKDILIHCEEYCSLNPAEPLEVPEQNILDIKKNPKLHDFEQDKSKLLSRIVDTISQLSIIANIHSQLTDIKNILITGIADDLSVKYCLDHNDVETIFFHAKEEGKFVDQLQSDDDFSIKAVYVELAEEIAYHPTILSALVKKFVEHFAKDVKTQNKTQAVFDAVRIYQPCLKEEISLKNIAKEIKLNLEEKNIFEENIHVLESRFLSYKFFHYEKTADDDIITQLSTLQAKLKRAAIEYTARNNNFNFVLRGFRPSEKLKSTSGMIAEVDRLLKIMRSPDKVIIPSRWDADAAAKQEGSVLKKLSDELISLKNIVESTEILQMELS